MTPKSTSHSFILRVLSAIVLMPLVLYVLIYGGWPFTLFMGIAIGIAFKEWTLMAKLAAKPWIDGIAGLVYIAVCFAAFIYLRLHYVDNGTGLALVLMLCVWASDSGAYFSGKAIGGPKLAPSISPKKTWAGLIGGCIASAATFYAFAYYIGPFLGAEIWSDLNLPEGFSLAAIIVFGVVIGVSGQMGDLLISREKRKVGVKDTGALIPGHGGLLDRIDALLLASPVFVLGLKVIGV